MELWEPRNDVFPDGFKFTEPLPLALHNRWMSGVNNTYIEDLGFASSFIVEEKSDFALVRSHPSLRVRARAAAHPRFSSLILQPIKADVFEYMMGRAKAWGMVLYEQASRRRGRPGAASRASPGKLTHALTRIRTRRTGSSLCGVE